jgi:hypothetical protein
MKIPGLGLDFLRLLLDQRIPDWQKLPSLYLSLHTAQPKGQDDAETTYPTYARLPVARQGIFRFEIITEAGRDSARATLTATLSWPRVPALVAALPRITWVALGQVATGTGRIFYPMALRTPGIDVVEGLIPEVQPGDLRIDEA